MTSEPRFPELAAEKRTGRLEDLRVLRLAQLYERAYEGFVHEVASAMSDERVRAKLEELAPATDDHGARIGEEIAKIIASLKPDERRKAERAALLAVVEVERAAHEFYVANMDNIHDPALIDLFEELAHAEAKHIRIAQSAVDVHESSAKTPSA